MKNEVNKDWESEIRGPNKRLIYGNWSNHGKLPFNGQLSTAKNKKSATNKGAGESGDEEGGGKGRTSRGQHYIEIQDHDTMKKCMYTYLSEYNKYAKDRMDLVLFTAAIEHVARIIRCLQQPQGT